MTSIVICFCLHSSKHFLSEGLCYCDHETARKLFTVTVKRRENEGQAEFEKRVLEVTAAYKMYSRQHFQNCIYSVSIHFLRQFHVPSFSVCNKTTLFYNRIMDRPMNSQRKRRKPFVIISKILHFQITILKTFSRH